MTFQKFPSIEGFHNTIKALRRYQGMVPSELRADALVFRGKVKLHGTNTGVRITANGDVTAQSRTRDLAIGDDNYGFAAWVNERRGYFSRITEYFDDTVVVYGEWAGPGIQKKVAVSTIEQKTFFPFAIYTVTDGSFYVNPDTIDFVLNYPSLTEPQIERPENIVTLPWATDGIAIDPYDETSVTAAADLLNAMVEEIDRVDPFIRDRYGIEGCGEGLVMVPIRRINTLAFYSAYAFKVKGASHSVTKADKPAKVTSFVSSDVKELASHFLTEARYEQAIHEACGGDADIRKTADFLKWIGGDVKKESVAECEAAGLVWKDISKHVTAEAARWYRHRCEPLKFAA